MKSLLDLVHSTNEFAAGIDRYLQRIHTDDPNESHSDRLSSAHMKRYDLGRTCKIVWGRVVDSIPYCHWYKVQPEGAKSVIPCCMLAGTALTPFGVRHHGPLHPNCSVFILLHPTNPYGVIIGVEPSHQFDPTKGLSDYITMCSANSTQTEMVNRFPFTLPQNGTIVDWSSGRPLDATTAGEVGWFAESGVGVFIDSAMAFMRADDNCGVWAFYRDQLLRMSGHNLQIRSSAMEIEALDDQGEVSVTHGYAGFPWETLGGLTPEAALHKERAADENQVSSPHYSRYEPVHDDQQPFFRSMQYHGYLGGGGKRIVAAPPQSGNPVNRYSEKRVAPGLFEETVSPTGLVTIKTAKGYRIIKKLLIPVPKAIRRPEDRTGDTPENYKASSQLGSGPVHVVKGDMKFSGDHSLNRTAGLMDAHAYGGNWEGLAPFHYHGNDWYTPEESEVSETVKAKGVARIDFSALQNGGRLSPPQPTQIHVDHRYKNVDYYATYSYVDMMDDGGIAMGDGYGSSITLAQGDIVLAPAGDIVLAPGRRIIGLAGSDCVIRARNSVDISATDKDVRIHAGHALYHSANSGIVLDDRSPGSNFSGWTDKVGEDCEPSGIILKTSKSAVTVLANMVYLRAGIGNPGGGIYLDSGQGLGLISTNSSTFSRFLTSAGDYFGSGGSVGGVNLYSATGNVLSAGLQVKGVGLFSDSVVSGSHLLALGHIGTGLAKQYKNLVGELSGKSLDETNSMVDQVTEAESSAVSSGVNFYNDAYTSGLYSDGRPGHDGVIADIGFSFRTQTQYRTSEFIMAESRWQQMARIWGYNGQKWVERPVEKSGQKTYPFPGREKLTEEPVWIQQDLQLFDMEEGAAKPRTDPLYSDPSYGIPNAVVMNTNYAVI